MADSFYDVLTLSHRVKRAGREAVEKLPVGILLYDEAKSIEWHNPYIADLLGVDTAVGLKLKEVLPGLEQVKLEDSFEFGHDGRHYRALHHKDDRLLYITDMTEDRELQERYERERGLPSGSSC